MSLAYVGKLSLSAILPTSVTAVGSASASLSATLPVVSADLAGAVTLSAQIGATPPDLTAEIVTVGEIALGLAAAVTLGAPFVDIQVSSLDALIAELAPVVGDLSASLVLTAPIAALFAESNVQAYSFAGTSAELGPLLAAALAPGMPDGAPAGATITGFVLASTAGATWTGLQTFFPPLPGSQFAGTLVPLGGLTVGALVGLLAGGILAANESLELELEVLGARLRGALAAQVQLTVSPPSLVGNVAIVGQLAASLGAYTLADYVTPTVAIAAAAALVTRITALEAQLSANVSELASITSALATAGVLAFTYTGTAADLPGAIAAAVGGGWPDGTSSSSASNALVLLASGGGTASALSVLFGGL